MYMMMGRVIERMAYGRLKVKVYLLNAVDGKNEIEGLIETITMHSVNVRVNEKRWIMPWRNILGVVEL